MADKVNTPDENTPVTGADGATVERTDATQTAVETNVVTPTTDADAAPTETKPTDEAEKALSQKLMKQEGVKKIYRTAKDGYWFTLLDLATEHKTKVGGDLETFEDTDAKTE